MKSPGRFFRDTEVEDLARGGIDMTKGPLFGKMIAFALPLMASGILQLLFNAADTAVVGRFTGQHALAAVGSNGPLINMIVTLFMGLSVGANVLTAQYLGSGRLSDLRKRCIPPSFPA